MKTFSYLPILLSMLIAAVPATGAEKKVETKDPAGLSDQLDDDLLEGIRGRSLPDSVFDPINASAIILWDEARLDPERMIRDGKAQGLLMRLQGEVMAESR